MKKTVSLLLLAVILFGVLGGCEQDTKTPGNALRSGEQGATAPGDKPVTGAIDGNNKTSQSFGQAVQSAKQRDTAPVLDKADRIALVNGNNDFAFRLYQAVREAKDGNLFYSPYSISAALAMSYAGARGETEKAISDAMSFRMPQDKLHPGFNSLDLQFKERGKGAQGKDDKGFRLNVVNAIWGQKGFKFLESFVDTLAVNYGAGLRTLDFVKETETSRVAINDWVSEQTEGRIKDLIPPGILNDLTRMVLTNAIYFNAAWQRPFKEEATSDGPFRLLGGDEVTAPMMRQVASFRYGKGDDYQAVELPYDGNALSMVILLPAAGSFDSFEQTLSAEFVSGIIGKLREHTVTITMPRFEFESNLGLKEALTALGMGVAFTENADFSGMTGRRDLLIRDVLHKAFVSLDEEGTEAAAATGAIYSITTVPPPAEFKADRPFIFLIRDIPTASTIFVGRVFNPAK